MKVNYYTKKFFYMFAIASCIVGVIQLIMFGIVHSENFNVIIRAISDSAALFFFATNGFILFLKKDNIRLILQELKILLDFRNSKNEEPAKIKSYFDGHNRVMNIYSAVFISGILASGAFWFPYFINGSKYYGANFWFPFNDDSAAKFPFNQLWTN